MTDPATAISQVTRPDSDLARAAAERFAERAAEEGLVEIAYASIDSPFGEVILAATDRGLVRVNLPAYEPEGFLARLSEEISPAILESPARLDHARRQFESYFEGELQKFDLPLDWRLGGEGFRRRALGAINRIPYGKTRSYAEIAATAGNPRAYRAAGSACGANPLPIIVPCHRVLQSGGRIGNYGGGPRMKEGLLRLEGVEVDR